MSTELKAMMSTNQERKVHELKTLKPYFQDVYSGIKKFEVRFNDRNFQVNDSLNLKEFDGITQTHTGRSVIKRVTYVLDDPRFVKNGFVIMGIK
jgi:ribosomal protein L15E